MKPAFFFIAFFLLARYSVAQTDIYFATASYSIDRAQQKRIDSFVHSVSIKPTDKISVTGYADHRKGGGNNDTLSLRRAQAVAGALVNAGVPGASIVLCEGRGEITRNGAASIAELQQDRRVTITLANPTLQPAANSVVKMTRADSFFTNPKNIKVDARYTLDILFAHGSLKVLTSSMPEMKSLYNFMNDNPNVSIQIEGHVCCPTGSPASLRNGQHASEARAKYVRDYLVSKGIDSNRLSYAGFGATRPLVAEETPEDAQKNRRVDVRIVRH